MSETLIDALEGNGKVFVGEQFFADVTYRIRRYQEYDRLPRMELDLIVLSRKIPVDTTRYTLQLDNGKKLNFYPATATSVLATGDVY